MAALDNFDKNVLKKEGLEVAEKLRMNNGREADTDVKIKKKVLTKTDPNETGKYGQSREALIKANSISAFAKGLKISQDQLVNALNKFKALDTDGNGVIDKNEFAKGFGMKSDGGKMKMMFDAVDVDKNGGISYKEFLIAAAHLNRDISDAFKARFCFKMADRDNDGACTFDELRLFLLNAMYAGSNAQGRMIEKVSRIVTETLGVEASERLTEDQFVKLSLENPQVFRPMFTVYSDMSKAFRGALHNTGGPRTSMGELKKYFDMDQGDGQPESIQSSTASTFGRVVGTKSRSETFRGAEGNVFSG